MIEHEDHCRHEVGVQVFQSVDVRQVSHFSEPRVGASGAYVGKRGVEDYGRDVVLLLEPAGRLDGRVEVVDGFLGMCVAVAVGVEGKRAVGVDDIWHG